MRHDVEDQVRGHLDRGEKSAAVEAGLLGYGRELAGFLRGVLHSAQHADEVYSDLCVDIWSGISDFRWNSSFRTWAFKLAHNAVVRFYKDPYRKRRSPLSDHPEINEIEQRIRSTTAPHLRTDVKESVTRLRQQLAPDDRELLILRLDRKLPWSDVTRVMIGEDGSDDEALSRKQVALRNQYSRIKEKIREMAREEGLLDKK